jgi:hypothetical protein
MNLPDQAAADASPAPSLEASDWPLHGLADDMRPALANALIQGPAGLATIVSLGDGGPRPVGTQMVFGVDSRAGFLSGGCIEADVEDHARACIADGRAPAAGLWRGQPLARHPPAVRRADRDPGRTNHPGRCGRPRPAGPGPGPGPGDLDQRRPARVCAPVPELVSAWPQAFARRFDPPPRLVVFGGTPPPWRWRAWGPVGLPDHPGAAQGPDRAAAPARRGLSPRRGRGRRGGDRPGFLDGGGDLRPRRGRSTTRPCWPPCPRPRPMSACWAPGGGWASGWTACARPA